MKAIKVLALFLALATIVLVSCKKSELKEEPVRTQTTMSALKADPKFSWETTKNIEVSLTAGTTGVVYIRPQEGDYYFYKGMLTAGKPFTTRIALPTYMGKLKLTFKGIVHEVSVSGNKLSFTF